MIYITSDWHLTKESIKDYANMLAGLNEEDIVLNLGDLSNDWTLVDELPWFCRELSASKCRMILLDGNHDDMNYLDRLPVECCFGAKGNWVGTNIFHVKRGEVLGLEGKKFLTLGGGFSGEKYIRRHPDLWQERETPSADEMNYMLKSCEDHDFYFDYILSHAMPLSVMRNRDLGNEYNCYHAFLDGVAASVQRKHWYCGHHHRNEAGEDGFEIVYQKLHCLKKL